MTLSIVNEAWEPIKFITLTFASVEIGVAPSRACLISSGDKIVFKRKQCETRLKTLVISSPFCLIKSSDASGIVEPRVKAFFYQLRLL